MNVDLLFRLFSPPLYNVVFVTIVYDDDDILITPIEILFYLDGSIN